MTNGKTFLAIPRYQYQEKVINCKDFGLEEATDFDRVTDQGVVGYLSMDPRMYNAARQQYLLLDVPPLKVKNTSPMTDIYGDKNNVRDGYISSYENIRGGNIIYYKDYGNNLPYTSPLYNIQSYMKPSVLTDPMGQTSTIYKRIPIPSEIEKISDYSFDRDQMEFREDLMSLQSQRMNKNSYDSYDYYKNL